MVANESRPLSLPRALPAYVAAVGLCLALMFWLLHLGQADLTLPLSYQGDSLYYEMLVQTTVETGWYLHNDRLGAPDGLDMNDFPMSDGLNFGLIKVISWFTANPILAFNLFYLLTFPLTTLTSLFVFRRLGCAPGPSLLGSLLFTFLPFHLFRVCQLFLASYFLVPLMVLVILWVERGTPAVAEADPQRRFGRRGGRLLAGVAICALIGSAGVYFAFFGCFFLVIAGLRSAWRQRSPAALAPAGIFVAAIVLAGLANTASYLTYRAEHGANHQSVLRSPVGAELYGLKVSQLILPVTNHRVAPLARGRDLFNRKMPLVTENSDSSLGILGSLGFLVLIAILFVRRGAARDSSQGTGNEASLLVGQGHSTTAAPTLLESLSILNLSALLLGAVGGFGFFVCLALPEIRSFNRISVYVAFLSILAMVLVLQAFQRRFLRSWKGRWLFRGALGAMLILGVLDQVPSPLPFADPEPIRQDAAFIQRIEQELPEGALVFQLPFVAFPENPPVERMRDYDHLRAYMHSRTLRWSYPTMRGRPGHDWQKAVAAMPADQLVPTLIQAGFQGIYIDRYGYADGAAQLEADLGRRLSCPPLVSRDGRLAFFQLYQ
jgi:phosphoglycerol transferase